MDDTEVALRKSLPEIRARRCSGDVRLVFFDVDRALGAVGDREAGLLLEARRDGAVADFMGVPVVVELEELRGDDEAAARQTVTVFYLNSRSGICFRRNEFLISELE